MGKRDKKGGGERREDASIGSAREWPREARYRRGKGWKGRRKRSGSRETSVRGV